MKAAKPVTILLVDDVEAWRRSVCSMLAKHDRFHVVAEACSGLEAIQKFQKLQPDVILLDIGLPDVNGIEVGRRVGQVAPGAKVLFVSQNTDLDVVQAAMSNGAKGYVLKVDAGRDLLPAMEAALRGERFSRLT